jgi:hypothetical protein
MMYWSEFNANSRNLVRFGLSLKRLLWNSAEHSILNAPGIGLSQACVSSELEVDGYGPHGGQHIHLLASYLDIIVFDWILAPSQ